ncbi:MULTISPECIES: flagellar hook-basal body protein [unclassified Butyrivibrio]|uniref:flagellar hook-basal body protein n=1 Tax=unclassified Butyrivibrio TaxID=2639466 RepID=UPI0003B5D7FF|nr:MULTISPECIES: flagellar hook-basal body protein [unclassified Butyrivibrio]MDC7292914.1 flagellar hook-basal body protein [Butyrivibrio sp. DSM 10294]
MVKGLYTAYTGMINEQHRMDVLTNNLANANTNGYKKEGATAQSFNDQLALKIKDYTDAPFTARRLGVINPGVKIGEGYVDWSEGPMRETGNTFDLAIGGYGFFGIEYTNKAKNIEIDTPNVTQIMYTRDGDFTLTSEGVLVTQDGDFVLDQDGQHIQINPDLDVDINTRGELIQDGEVVATIGRFDFEKTTYPDGRITYDTLEHYGENMYIATDQAVAIDATGSIYAGFLEQSNVSVVDEMVNMIAVQRNYDTNQRMITTIDETLEIAVNQLGKL